MSKTLAINSPKQRVQQRPMNRELETLRERFRQRILQEQIRERAYELYEERGCVHGHHEEDWARAESEVLERAEPRRAA